MPEKKEKPITVIQLIKFFKDFRDESDTKVVVDCQGKKYGLGWCERYGENLLFDSEPDMDFTCSSEAFWNDLESNYSKYKNGRRQTLYYRNESMNLAYNGMYKVTGVKKYGKRFTLVTEKVND